MARYKIEDVVRFLDQHGCTFDGDRIDIGMGWFAPDNIAFVLPDPSDGYVDADVVDLILADRWIWTGPTRMTRYPD